MPKMPAIKIGVTGTIASGKSTVTKILAKDFPTISADDIVHKLYEDKAVAKMINQELFALDSDIIDLTMISSQLFKDPLFKAKLEGIIHPLVRSELLAFASDKVGIVVLEIPLLFEAKMEDIVDYSILVMADEEIVIERLINKRGFKRSEALERIKNQLPVKEKMQKADYIIENNASYDDLVLSVKAVLKKIERVI